MKKDVTILKRQFHDKMYDKTLNLIATECFMKGLVLDINKEDDKDTLKFANELFQRMDLRGKMSHAMEAATDIKSKNLLGGLHSAIESVVKTATNRVVEDESIYADNDDIYKYSNDEIQDFIKSKKELRLDEISEIIKDKVIQTIKNEKESFIKSQKIRDEIKEVIDKDDDSALESYMNIVLTKSEPRDHISFFSKVQDVCIEALMYNVENISESKLPYNLISSVVTESMVDIGFCGDVVIEDAVKYISSVDTFVQTTETDYAGRLQAATKTAFACTVCILTIFEVLKTLRIYDIDTKDMRDFIERSPNVKAYQKSKIEAIKKCLDDTTLALKKLYAGGDKNAEKIGEIFNALKSTQADMEKIKDKLSGDMVELVMNCINDNIRDILEYQSSINVIVGKYEDLGYYAKREFDENIASLTKYLSMVSRNPLVFTIDLHVDSTIQATSSDRHYIDVFGMDRQNNPVVNYMMTINTTSYPGKTLLSVLREIASYSNLGMKIVRVYLTDKCAYEDLIK